MAARAATDSAKLICLFWALLAFVASGFEHSVANMTIFSLGIFGHLAGGTASEMARNLLYTVPGNILGGGVMVGVAYAWIGRDATAAKSSVDEMVAVASIDLVTAEPDPEPEPEPVASS